MPFIVLKRNDIPSGTLQVLDLKPNTSQRNLIYDPPGQTKYVNPVLNERVAVRGTLGVDPVVSHVSARGLSAWFLATVNDGTGAEATGTIEIAVGNAAPADEITVDASAVGGPVVLFTATAGAPVLPTDFQVGGDNNATAANLLVALQDPANGLVPFVTAVVGGSPNEIDLSAVAVGAAGNGIALATTGADIVVPANLAGGVDAAPLTPAEASQMAEDILVDLVRFGDLSLPAVGADLVAVNAILAAVVATVSLTAEQLMEMLGILSGRVFLLPEGVQLADAGGVYSVSPAIGTAEGPRFLDPSTRHTYDSGDLRISLGEGELAGFTSPDFTYRETGGDRGEAVVVYNDDGTLFTVTP